MSGNDTEYTVEHQLPGLQPAEPALVKKAYAAPTFICLETALTAIGTSIGNDGAGTFTGS